MYWNLSSVFAHQLPHNVEPLTCLISLLSRPCDGWCPLIKLDAETCSSGICLLSSPAAALQSMCRPSVECLVEKRIKLVLASIVLLKSLEHFSISSELPTCFERLDTKVLSDKSQQMQIIDLTNRKSRQVRATSVKRGKTCNP